MSKFTISIILIITMLVSNAIYIINSDIETAKEKAKQRERVLDFEMTPQFQIKKTSKNNINYINEYYLKDNYVG